MRFVRLEQDIYSLCFTPEQRKSMSFERMYGCVYSIVVHCGVTGRSQRTAVSALVAYVAAVAKRAAAFYDSFEAFKEFGEMLNDVHLYPGNTVMKPVHVRVKGILAVGWTLRIREQIRRADMKRAFDQLFYRAARRAWRPGGKAAKRALDAYEHDASSAWDATPAKRVRLAES